MVHPQLKGHRHRKIVFFCLILYLDINLRPTCFFRVSRFPLFLFWSKFENMHDRRTFNIEERLFEIEERYLKWRIIISNPGTVYESEVQLFEAKYSYLK